MVLHGFGTPGKYVHTYSSRFLGLGWIDMTVQPHSQGCGRHDAVPLKWTPQWCPPISLGVNSHCQDLSVCYTVWWLWKAYWWTLPTVLWHLSPFQITEKKISFTRGCEAAVIILTCVVDSFSHLRAISCNRTSQLSLWLDLQNKWNPQITGIKSKGLAWHIKNVEARVLSTPVLRNCDCRCTKSALLRHWSFHRAWLHLVWRTTIS
jgi:hypothetical protein